MESTQVDLQVTLAAMVVLWLVCVMIERAWERHRPKVLAVVEDSEIDYRMILMNCDFDNWVIRRYKTAENLEWIFAKNPPDAALVDYYLAGKTNGDEVVKLCDKLGIRSKLVTAGSQKIQGIPSTRIFRKSPDPEYFDKISQWVKFKIA